MKCCIAGYLMDKKELIELLKECDAIQFGRFVLTSGAVSD